MKHLWFGILLCAIFFASCTLSSKKRYITIDGHAQGTTYHIQYQDLNEIYYKQEIDSLLYIVDQSLSIYLPNSIISRVNNNDTNIHLDQHFIRVISKAQEISKVTQGAFDITLGSIINSWGFGSTNGYKPVDSSKVDSMIQYVGYQTIKIKNNTILKKYKETSLNVNAIAQGYGVDVIADFFDQKGVGNYIVELGGEVRAKGKNSKNHLWKIGIDRPIEGNINPGENLQTILKLNNKALATSGNYRQYYTKNGRKFVHTIDPKTGYPVSSNLLSATVIADNCMTADAYATAFMVMGLDKSIHFLKNHPFLEAYLIYNDDGGEYKTFITNQIKDCIINTN